MGVWVKECGIGMGWGFEDGDEESDWDENLDGEMMEEGV